VGSALLLLAASFVCTSSAHALGWELVFSEEFDTAQLDRQVWSTRYIYDNDQNDTFAANGERQRYRDNQNHVLRDGHVDLIAKRAKVDAEHEYESGLLRSSQTFYYGYFEARVKTPSAKGTWPAFWLAADRDRDGDIQHPPEIDVFDNANNGKDSTSSMVWFGGVADKQSKRQGGELVWADPAVNRGEYEYYQAGKDLTGEWHVYGLLWTPSEITLWLDGKRIATRKYSWVSNAGQLAGPAHVLFNLAVGGPWAGRFGIDDKAFPQTFSIDYVRVCQLSSNKQKAHKACGKSTVTPDPDQYAYQSPLPGDLVRPTVFAAKLSKSTLYPAQTTQVTHKFSSSVSTHEAHDVFQYLVNENGQTVTQSHVSPKIPTTQWAGRNLTVTMPLEVPADADAGKYKLYVAVGSALEWDPEGKTFLKAITLQYASSVKKRERIVAEVVLGDTSEPRDLKLHLGAALRRLGRGHYGLATDDLRNLESRGAGAADALERGAATFQAQGQQCGCASVQTATWSHGKITPASPRRNSARVRPEPTHGASHSRGVTTRGATRSVRNRRGDV
jgi:beta-glucanase (GH16 family)